MASVLQATRRIAATEAAALAATEAVIQDEALLKRKELARNNHLGLLRAIIFLLQSIPPIQLKVKITQTRCLPCQHY